jgi:hypothetical protein
MQPPAVWRVLSYEASMLSLTALLYLILEPAATADLMRRVAENVEKPNPQRQQYVYTLKTHSRLLRTNSKLAREEKREYRVLPKEDATERELISFHGIYEKDKKHLPYNDPDFRQKKLDLDGELIEDLTDDHVANSDSRDGIDLDYFPIRTKDLPHYTFSFLGEQSLQGRRVARIQFAPTQKTWAHLWEGETLIDLEDAFPMQIQTKMAKKIPFAARALLGINLKQFGFGVTFVRLDKDLWFPKTYGTEFELTLFFGYKRVLAMSMEASDFRRTGADSSITFQTAEQKD